MGLYRIVRPDGSIEYSDVPSGPGQVTAVNGRGRPAPPPEEEEPYNHGQTKKLVAEARKRIPKIVDYLDYLEYLRSNSPLRLDRVLMQLKQDDPQTWLKLQKYPQFRPLRDTALGLKAGEKHLLAAAGMGSITGSAEKWFESTVKDMMKRDRWGPYADVLGAKASTLPAPKPPTYSRSRLGQYLKEEEPRAAKAAQAAAKELDSARAGLRAAKATAVTRVMGPVVDVGMAMLDPEVGKSAGNIALALKLRKLYERGILDEDGFIEAQGLLSQGRYIEMQKLMDDATRVQGAGR